MFNFSDLWTEKIVPFKVFGTEHLFLVALFVVIGAIMFRWGNRHDEIGKVQIGRYIAYTIFIFEVIWLAHKIGNGTFKASENLPFDLCNINALLIPLAMYDPRRREILFQVVYFWVMVGTIQGVLTPELDWAFPYIGYCKYWVIHAGLMVAVLYGALVLKVRPSLRGVGFAFLAINMYAIVMNGVNWVLHSNYGYLAHKPTTASLFDYFGEHYVLVAELVCLVLFFVVWLPFARKKTA